MKKVFSTILAFVIMLSTCAVFVNAEEGQIVQPRYTHILGISFDFAVSGGTAECQVIARAASLSDNVTVTVYIQRDDNGVWRPQGAGTTLNSGWRTEVNKAVSNVPSGYYYRVRADVSVYDSSGNLKEMVTEYSTEQYY